MPSQYWTPSESMTVDSNVSWLDDRSQIATCATELVKIVAGSAAMAAQRVRWRRPLVD